MSLLRRLLGKKVVDKLNFKSFAFLQDYSGDEGFKEICRTVFIFTIIPLVLSWYQAPWLGKGANTTKHKKSTRKASRAGSGERKKRLNGAENFSGKTLKQNATGDSTTATGSNFVKIMGKSLYI